MNDKLGQREMNGVLHEEPERSVFEGKRVRVTVEVLGEAAPGDK